MHVLSAGCGAGVPVRTTSHWDCHLPDGVWHEYQACLQAWPGAAAHIDEEFREYLRLDTLTVPGQAVQNGIAAEQGEAQRS